MSPAPNGTAPFLQISTLPPPSTPPSRRPLVINGTPHRGVSGRSPNLSMYPYLYVCYVPDGR
eukprot:scaffold9513_cov130-Skeletonema_dohrnii-CCMP3373.AAC.1